MLSSYYVLFYTIIAQYNSGPKKREYTIMSVRETEQSKYLIHLPIILAGSKNGQEARKFEIHNNNSYNNYYNNSLFLQFIESKYALHGLRKGW